MVLLCVIVAYAFEMLFQRQIIGKARMRAKEKGWYFAPVLRSGFRLCAKLEWRVCVYISGSVLFTRPGNCITLNGSPIALSDVMVLGLLGAVLGQHDRYAP